MRRRDAAYGACLAIAAAAQGAAQDYGATGVLSFFTEAVTGSGGSGEGGSASDDGATSALRATTNLGLAITTSTPRFQANFSPGVSASVATDSANSQMLAPSLSSGLRVFGARSTLTAAFSVVPDFVDDAQFTETGASAPDALQITSAASVGLTRALTPVLDGRAGLSARVVEFTADAPGLERSQSFGVNGGLARRVAPDLAITLDGGATQFFSGNGEDGLTTSLLGGFSASVTPRFSVSASIGPAVTFPGDGGDVEPSVAASLSGAYEAGQSALSFSLNQGVQQTSVGLVEDRLSGSLAYSRELTSRAQLGVTGTLGGQTGFVGGGDGDSGDRRTLSISPGLSYALSPDWSLGGGYAFRISDGADREQRHSVFVSLSRGLSLIP